MTDATRDRLRFSLGTRPAALGTHDRCVAAPARSQKADLYLSAASQRAHTGVHDLQRALYGLRGAINARHSWHRPPLPIGDMGPGLHRLWALMSADRWPPRQDTKPA